MAVAGGCKPPPGGRWRDAWVIGEKCKSLSINDCIILIFSPNNFTCLVEKPLRDIVDFCCRTTDGGRFLPSSSFSSVAMKSHFDRTACKMQPSRLRSMCTNYILYSPDIINRENIRFRTAFTRHCFPVSQTSGVSNYSVRTLSIC